MWKKSLEILRKNNSLSSIVTEAKKNLELLNKEINSLKERNKTQREENEKLTLEGENLKINCKEIEEKLEGLNKENGQLKETSELLNKEKFGLKIKIVV